MGKRKEKMMRKSRLAREVTSHLCMCGAPAVDKIKGVLVCAECMNPEYSQEYVAEQRRYWIEGFSRSSSIYECRIYGMAPPIITREERQKLGV